MSKRTKLIKSALQSQALARVGSWLTGREKEQIYRFQSNLFTKAENVTHLEIAISSIGSLRSLCFVQVGANDGRTDDPIHEHVLRHGSRALLIEPQPWLMDELRKNYEGFSGEMVIENIAIGPGETTLDLHILKQEFWDEYIARVGRHPSAIFSPDREQILKRVAPRLGLRQDEAGRALETLTVPTEPLFKVIERHGFDHVDVLQIDCEGWDFKVIQSLGSHRPSMINFESANLSKDDWDSFKYWCETEGYGFICGPTDTLAIQGFQHMVNL